MCGFAGILDFRKTRNASKLEAEVRLMAATLRHRGPDDDGTWVDASAGIAFGHRRLAVIDLSPMGHQPMISPSGRYVINYNGEIYNYRELHSELEKAGARPRLAGHSDTEVLLAALEFWGVPDALPKLNGMFSFALWDREQRELWLARDRFGEKPLYYGFHGGALLFASELKALQAVRSAEWEIDRNALALFFRYSAVPAPFTIYKKIFKLPAASFIRFSRSENPSPHAYWSLKEVAKAGVAASFTGDEQQAVAQLEQLMAGSVEQRMLADVPVGIFLSGGIDSSLVAALAQRASQAPVRTFSIGVRATSYNEAEDAQKVSQHLGTHHTELYVEPEAALAVIPKLAEIYDEPFADSSQIPTFLLSQLARCNVTVCLSGDGGDELFGGYNRYVWVERLWKRVGWMSFGARGALAKGMKSISPRSWERLLGAMERLPVENLNQRMAGDKLHKIASVIDSGSEQEIYLRLASHWFEPETLVPGANEPRVLFEKAPNGLRDFLDTMMYTDSVTFLPDDILTKVDRASMAVSLEVRAPYLDAEVVKFAWSLPKSMKIRNGKGKWLLRELLHRYIPAELVERPKMGFGIPLDAWLRGPLRAWAEDLLSEQRLRREGLVSPQVVREKWEEHLSGRHNWQYHLWDVLMYQSWFERVHAQREATCAAEVS